MIDEQTVNEMLLAADMNGFEKGREAGYKAGMMEAAKIVEENLIYGNREDPAWAQRIIAGEIRRRASELG
jgi:hypothetical protein